MFAHAVLVQIKKEKLIQSHFKDKNKINPTRVPLPLKPKI